MKTANCKTLLVNLDMEVLYYMESDLFPLWVAKHLIEGADDSDLETVLTSNSDDASLYRRLAMTGKFFCSNTEIFTPRIYLPMGLLAVAASLMQAGFPVEYFDFAEPGQSLDRFRCYIRQTKPSVIGFGPITPLFPQAILLASASFRDMKGVCHNVV